MIMNHPWFSKEPSPDLFKSLLPFEIDDAEKERRVTPKTARIIKRLYRNERLDARFWRAIRQITPDVNELG